MHALSMDYTARGHGRVADRVTNRGHRLLRHGAGETQNAARVDELCVGTEDGLDQGEPRRAAVQELEVGAILQPWHDHIIATLVPELAADRPVVDFVADAGRSEPGVQGPRGNSKGIQMTE